MTTSLITPLIKPMTAAQARKLTDRKIDTQHVHLIRAHIDNKIRDAARQGRSELHHPLDGIQTLCPQEVQDAIWKSLRKDGYTVEHKPDPDPGHPCSRPYTRITW